MSLLDDSLKHLAISDAEALSVNGFSNRILCCQIVELILKPMNIPLFEFSVAVSPKHSESLVIDNADKFPRYYLDRNIAKLEMEDWRVARSQS